MNFIFLRTPTARSKILQLTIGIGMLGIPVNFGGCAREPELFPVSFTAKSKKSGNFIGLNGLMKWRAWYFS